MGDKFRSHRGNDAFSVAADRADICRSQAGRYVVDWSRDHSGRALAIARPRTVDEAQQVVRCCAELGVPIAPQGGNTGLVSGAIGDNPQQMVVSLGRLNRTRDFDSANFLMVAEAGCVPQSAKQKAQSEGLLFPLSLGAEGSCQVGGNVATNAGGVNVLRYGMMRDLVLGLEVVLPDGSLWNGLSGLRKDNRGIDLKQLFVGGEGLLGIITAASLKLFPEPESVENPYIGMGSFAAAVELFSLARRTCADLLNAFEVIGSECPPLVADICLDLRNPLSFDAPVHVLMEVSASGNIGLRAVVEQFLADNLDSGLMRDAALAAHLSHARSFWRIREGLVEGHARRGYHVRSDISVVLPMIAPLIEKLRTMLATEFLGWTSQS